MRKAFTLVELMVVIAIIVVLMSALLPALDRAFDLADTTVCQVKMRNIHQALDVYFLDYKRAFPAHRYDEDANVDGTKLKWWATDLFPYGMVPEAFHCPSLKKERTDFNIRWAWAFNMQNVGYGYNAFFLGPYKYAGDINWTTNWVKKEHVVSPADLLVFADTNPVWSMSLWWPGSMGGQGQQEGVNTARHGAGGVLAFNDGHTEVRLNDAINPVGYIAYHPNSIKHWDPRQKRP